MADDLYVAVIVGLTLVPIVGTVLGWLSEDMGRKPCPACRHPEHWPWCRECGCDLFTEPSE